MSETLNPELTARVLSAAGRELAHAQHLPGEIYTSAEVLVRESDRIFGKDWLCFCREEEVANPGDYFAMKVIGEPVVVTRDQSGTLHAFSNLCRHRGVQVVADGMGNARRLTCRYHGWAYDLQGCLVGASLMEKTADFDRKNIRLNGMKVATWAGWVFINFDQDAEPLDEFVATLERDIGFLQQGRCRLAKKLETVWACNWKLVTENLCDPYHFRALHGQSFGARIPVEDYSFELRRRGGISASYDASSQTPDGVTPLGPMPWLSNYPVGLSVFGFLAPNLVVIGRIDEIHVYTVWPETVDRTRVVLHHLFAEEHFEQRGFETKAGVITDFLARIVDEDLSVAGELQQAAGSQRFIPGRLSWLEEGVHHQLRYNVERTFA